MTLIFRTAGALALALALAGCGVFGAPKLEQRWVYLGGEDSRHEIEFFKDGECVYDYDARGARNRFSCTWKRLEDKRIRISLRVMDRREMMSRDFSDVGLARFTHDGLYITDLGYAAYGEYLGPEALAAAEAFRTASRAENKQEAMVALANEGHPRAMNWVAWEASFKPGQFDGPTAVIYATRAVDAQRKIAAASKELWHTHRLAIYLDTFAAANARNGSFDKAVAAQKEALGLIEQVAKTAEEERRAGSLRRDQRAPTAYTLWEYRDRLMAYEDGEAVALASFAGAWMQAPDSEVQINTGSFRRLGWRYSDDGRSRWRTQHTGQIAAFGYRQIILQEGSRAALAHRSSRSGCDVDRIVVGDPLLTFDDSYGAPDSGRLFQHPYLYPSDAIDACRYNVNIDVRIPEIADPAPGYENEYVTGLEDEMSKGNTHAMELLLVHYAFSSRKPEPANAMRVAARLEAALKAQSTPSMDQPHYLIANAHALGGDFNKAKQALDRGLRLDRHILEGLRTLAAMEEDHGARTLMELQSDKVRFYEAWRVHFDARRPYLRQRPEPTPAPEAPTASPAEPPAPATPMP